MAITTDSSWHEALSLLRSSADGVGRLDYDARTLSISAAGKRIWLDCRDWVGIALIAATRLIAQAPGPILNLPRSPYGR
jgi:hypothetical protein